VQSGFLLNIVIRKRAPILKLFTGKDEALLIRRNTFLILDLGLDVVDGVRRLNIKGDGLTREGFDENLQQ